MKMGVSTLINKNASVCLCHQSGCEVHTLSYSEIVLSCSSRVDQTTVHIACKQDRGVRRGGKRGAGPDRERGGKGGRGEKREEQGWKGEERGGEERKELGWKGKGRRGEER